MTSISWAISVCRFNAERSLYWDRCLLPSWHLRGVSPREFSDTTRSSCWLAARRSWLWLAGQPTDYGCALQDDFGPFYGFAQSVNNLINRHQGDPVTFFQPCCKLNDIPTFEQKDQIVRHPHIPWGGCLVLPTKLIKPIIDISDKLIHRRLDDSKIGAALNLLHKTTWWDGANHVSHIGGWFPSQSDNDSNNTIIQEFRSGDMLNAQQLEK